MKQLLQHCDDCELYNFGIGSITYCYCLFMSDITKISCLFIFRISQLEGVQTLI